jgi:transposase InsO family protein
MGSWRATGSSSATGTASGRRDPAASSKVRGVRIVVTPVQAPTANAYAERFVRSIREECLDRLILFGERRLLRALDEFVAHYHGERNHQGLGNALIAPEGDPSRVLGSGVVSDWAGSCATTTAPPKSVG